MGKIIQVFVIVVFGLFLSACSSGKYAEMKKLESQASLNSVAIISAPATPVVAAVASGIPPIKNLKPEAPKVRIPQMSPKFLPAVVSYDGEEKPGTIVVKTDERYLYLIEEGGIARRYGIGVGRDGFRWSGTEIINRKAEWPGWTPPEEMHKRQPGLPAYMPGGPNNPLGARALYLGSTLYRIHGSNQPWTIGEEVSSGCFRMRNEDVIDLYERVPLGTKVIVL